MSGAEMIASHVWIARKADGTVVEWHQEDENSVTSKAEAVAMVQRTIDFWLLKLVADIQQSRKIPLEDAKTAACHSFRATMLGTLVQPWPKKWGMTMEDFVFEVK